MMELFQASMVMTLLPAAAYSAPEMGRRAVTGSVPRRRVEDGVLMSQQLKALRLDKRRWG